MVQKSAPLAQQVVMELLSALEDGSVGRDGQLPSEAELSQRYEVSRGTIREALSKLQDVGVIVRRHGAGTYVNRKFAGRPGIIRAWFDEASAFMDMIRCSDGTAACRILDTSLLPAGDLAEQLDIDPDNTVVRIEKLLFASSVPAIHCANYVPLGLLEPGLRNQAMDLYRSAETTYSFLEQYGHRRVHHQESEISAVLANDLLASLLACGIGAPLLCVEEVGCASDGLPLFYGINHFRGDLVKFRQLRQPAVDIAAPTPDEDLVAAG